MTSPGPESSSEASQVPPVFSDAEAEAYLQASQAIGDTLTDPEGRVIARPVVAGVMNEGMIISVVERTGLEDIDFAERYTVRAGNIADLVAGAPLATEVIPDSGRFVDRYDNGLTFLTTSHGTITFHGRDPGWVASLDGYRIFPLGEDGRPVPSDPATAAASRPAARHLGATWASVSLPGWEEYQRQQRNDT